MAILADQICAQKILNRLTMMGPLRMKLTICFSLASRIGAAGLLAA